MVGLIMTNSQMGVSSLKRNTLFGSNYGCNSFCSYAFWIPRTPIFSIGLNVKKNENNQFLGVKIQNSRTTKALLKGESDNQLVEGGVPEKESEFKPSFNEYLKVMELVRVRRDKRQANNSKKQKMDNNPIEKGLFRTSPVEEGEENVKLETIQTPLNQEKVLQVVGEGPSKNGLGIVGKQNQVRSKLSHNGKGSKDFKDEIDSKEGNVDAKFNKRSGREITRGMFSKNQINRVEQEPEYTSWERAQGSSRALASVQSKHRNINTESKQVLLRKKGTDISQQDHKSLPKSFEEGKPDIRRDKEFHGGLERKYFQVEEVTTNEFEHRNGKLTSSSKVLSGRANKYDSEVERAAFKTFDEFNDVADKPRVPRVEMEERIQKLANRLNGADIDMPEWMFSKTMRSAGIRYSDHSILRIIQILGKLGNWRRVLQVIEWLQRHERFKSYKLRFIYTTALDVLGKANRPAEALNVFHSMQQHISSYPDLVAYHCIAVSLGKAGYLKELFDVIDSMRSPPKKMLKTRALGEWDPRLEPDIVIYNAVLNACVQQKQWEGAFWVLQQLKQQGQQPSSSTYGLVMEVMFACGKFNLVHEFFRKLKKSCFPNALTYKVLVNTLWQEGKTDEAVLAVQDMEKRGIVGPAALYYDLARCLCSAGRCQEALEQMEKICKVANKPLVVTYTGLIQACLDSGNVQDGAFIFSKMQNFCSPNLVTCNIMLKAYLEHGMFEEAKELFQKMSEDANRISRSSDYRLRVIPDIYTFNTMLDACIANKRWDDFENIYKRMLHHGYHFNPKRHLRMILEASRAGKGDLLETTWIYLAESGRMPPAPLIKERFFMKLENDDYTSAVSCITSHPIKELQALSKMGWLNLLQENAHRFHRDAAFRLIHEVSIVVNKHESPNLVLQNLRSACQEFCRTYITLAEIKQIEAIRIE